MNSTRNNFFNKQKQRKDQKILEYKSALLRENQIRIKANDSMSIDKIKLVPQRSKVMASLENPKLKNLQMLHMKRTGEQLLRYKRPKVKDLNSDIRLP
jgi:hypothetical protein